MYHRPSGSGVGEKRTGAALPIFPRKRPRMALMAFSNSQSSSDQVTQHRRQDRTSYVFTAAEGKENSEPYNRSGKETTKWSAYKPAVTGHVTVTPAMVQPHSSTSYWDDTRDLDVTRDSSGSSSSATNDQVPTQKDHAVMQSQLMNSVHLLTATSQGVQHWAGYQQHISLMFEVFGTLTSQIERGEMGAKKFTLQAVDGPLNCLFWEIDYKIPSTLTRGRLCRAVGKWDTHKAVLKCVSIRLADSNEWNSVKTMVATSDKYMRQTASSLNEI